MDEAERGRLSSVHYCRGAYAWRDCVRIAWAYVHMRYDMFANKCDGEGRREEKGGTGFSIIRWCDN
jgi:hypothetical protein